MIKWGKKGQKWIISISIIKSGCNKNVKMIVSFLCNQIKNIFFQFQNIVFVVRKPPKNITTLLCNEETCSGLYFQSEWFTASGDCPCIKSRFMYFR